MLLLCWNILLFRLRKAGKLANIACVNRTTIAWDDCDEYIFASEIALQMMLDTADARSMDDILCDPQLGTRFDQVAAQLAPGYKPFEYRWAALRLRKEAKKARSRAAVLKVPKRFSEKTPVTELQIEDLGESPGSVHPVGQHHLGESARLG